MEALQITNNNEDILSNHTEKNANSWIDYLYRVVYCRMKLSQIPMHLRTSDICIAAVELDERSYQDVPQKLRTIKLRITIALKNKKSWTSIRGAKLELCLLTCLSE
jgi:hypothetical protein